MHYLYKITNQLNGKIYIGQTVNEKRRWTAHLSYAKKPEETGQHIHRAMAKYGVENFIYEIISTCETQEDADEAEIQLIKQYDSRNEEKGYNVAPGGNVVWPSGLPPHMYPSYGKKCSDEKKKKISDSNKNKNLGKEPWQKGKTSIIEPRILSGTDHPMYGKTHTKESRLKISNTHKGKLKSEKMKLNLSESKKTPISFDVEYSIYLEYNKTGYGNGISLDSLSKKYKIGRKRVKEIIVKYGGKIYSRKGI